MVNVNALINTQRRPLAAGTVPAVNSLNVGNFNAPAARNALLGGQRRVQEGELNQQKIEANDEAQAGRILKDFAAATLNATTPQEFEIAKQGFAQRHGIDPGNLAQITFDQIPQIRNEARGVGAIFDARAKLAASNRITPLQQAQLDLKRRAVRVSEFEAGLPSPGTPGSAPRRQPSIPGFTPPKGFRLRLDDQGQPVTNEFGQPEVEPIPGGPKTALPAEIAGRLALAEQGLSQLARVREFFASDKFTPGARLQQAFNAGEIGRIDRDVGIAAEAILRAATGAAAPDTEVARFKNFFAPGPADTKTTALDKLDRLRQLSARVVRDITRGRGGPSLETRRILENEFGVDTGSGGGTGLGQIQPGAPISGTPAISAPTPSLGAPPPGGQSSVAPDDGRSLAFPGGRGGQGRTSTGVPFRIR